MGDKKNLFYVVCVGFLFSGCASISTGWTPYPAYAPQTVSETVEVLNFAPGREYKTLGSIHTEAMSQKSAMNEAVKVAQSKGADAIIITKSKPSFLILIPWHVMDSTAIKYER